MTDKEYEAQKKRIEALRDKWEDTLGLGWWTIKHEYVRGTHDGGETFYQPFVGKGGRYTTIMEVATDYYYKFASITFYLETMLDYPDDKQLEKYFVHECCHIFLKPMQTKQCAKEEELVATQLADALIWTREAGATDAKKAIKPIPKTHK